MLKKQIIAFIDYFYPPFRKLMPIQTFRYAACGGFNTAVDIVVYSFAYNILYHKDVVHVGFISLKPYIAAFITSFAISFPSGFFMNRHIVFSDSKLRGRVQLFRYFLLVAICIALNYFFIKFFVERVGLFPTVAKILTTGIVVFFSYLTQKHFTFKAGEPNLLPNEGA